MLYGRICARGLTDVHLVVPGIADRAQVEGREARNHCVAMIMRRNRDDVAFSNSVLLQP